MPSARRVRCRKRRGQVNSQVVPKKKCELCNGLIPQDIMERHQSQCRSRLGRQGEVGVQDENDASNEFDWVREGFPDDDGDCGFYGPEEQEIQSLNNQAVKGDESLEIDTPIGKVVKVVQRCCRKSWMEDENNEEAGNSNEDSESDDEVPTEWDDEEDDQQWNKTDDCESVASVEAVAMTSLEFCDHQDAWNHNQELKEEYGRIANRAGYVHKVEWSGTKPSNLSPADPLNEILQGKEGLTLGRCYEDLTEEKPAVQLENSELSMLRLIEFCDKHPNNSRGFVDGFLDILVEEMRDRKFNPENRPSREKLSKKLMEMYGSGCWPDITQLTVANEDRIVVLQEETDTTAPTKRQKTNNGEMIGLNPTQICQSNAYLALPQEIDNRERFVIEVISFSARNMILDLLGDQSIFGDTKNLVVNEDNHFLPYHNTSGINDELMDGTWYRETLHRLKNHAADPFREEVEFLLPLVMYVDKTGTSINQRYPLEPFIFTTAVIRKQLRNLPTSWRPLGYIPDLEAKSAAEKTYINRRNKGSTAQAYHLALETIISGIEEIQNKGIVHWLRFGNFVKKVRIRPEVACIINDGKSADMLTLRVPSHHPSRRISRSCCTIQEECDQTTKKCQYVQMTDNTLELFRVVGMSEKMIQEDPVYMQPTGRKPTDDKAKSILTEAKESLDKLSFHPVRSAFLARCIRFGLDPRNVWGANPVDLMHAFQSGILMYLVKMVCEILQPKKQMELDRLVHKLFHRLRSKERDDYPRMNFSKGFSKLTLLTSDEWAGKLFVILIVLHTEEGSKLFDSANIFGSMDIPKPDKYWEMAASEASHQFQVLANGLLNPEETDETDNNKHKKKNSVTEEEPEEMLRKCSANDFTELAEALLCFHSWYKRGVNNLNSRGGIDKAAIHGSVSRMLSMVRWYTPRKKGNGWRIQKFHDLLHLADDIERFGSPGNFDAGPMESGLRYWAKLPASTSQMRGYTTFARQVAMRTFEFQCFSKALRIHGLNRPKIVSEINSQSGNNDASPCLMGTKFRVYKSQPPGVPAGTLEKGTEIYHPTTAIRKKHCHGAFVVSPVIENFLRFAPKAEEDKLPLVEESDQKYWELRTEISLCPPDYYVNEEPTRISLRCHPNYRNEGPWFDWIMVRFNTDGIEFEESDHATQFRKEIVPSKVLAVADFGNEDARILVHGCEYRSKKQQTESDTVLLERWELAYHDLSKSLPKKKTRGQTYLTPQLTWIEPEAVVSRCLVVEEEPGIFEVAPFDSNTGRIKNRVTLVRRREQWPNEFTGET